MNLRLIWRSLFHSTRVLATGALWNAGFEALWRDRVRWSETAMKCYKTWGWPWGQDVPSPGDRMPLDFWRDLEKGESSSEFFRQQIGLGGAQYRRGESFRHMADRLWPE